MRYVVLGASAAGINGAKTLREIDDTAEIILISKDDKVYSRCILHHYMEGIRSVEGLDFAGADFFEKYNITWKKGVAAISLDTDSKEVLLENGEIVTFDKLLIATGASTFMPPIENIKNAGGVFGFRNLNDIYDIMDRVKYAKHVVVLGAGLVGVDAISGLLHLHNDITLLEFKNHMLSMQLDARASKTYQDAFAEKGVKQMYGAGVSKIILDNDGYVEELELSTGDRVLCDLLIVATSVAANIGFLKDSGIKCERGLIIDPSGRTNHPDVFGAGDVTGTSPIWPAAVKESIIAAHNMTGAAKEMDDFFSSKCTMNFLGIPTLSLGITNTDDTDYLTEIEDKNGNYKKIVHKDGKIYGAILQGDISYAGILTRLIKDKIDISKVEKPIFKIDYSDFFRINKDYSYSF